MTLIELEEMEFYAFHGCYKEEQLAGNKFIAYVAFETDTSAAEESDNIHDTVNYAAVYGLVKKEMEQKSHLIEHLGRRIVVSIKKNYPQLHSVKVKISKMNPPMGGNMNCVSATVFG